MSSIIEATQLSSLRACLLRQQVCCVATSGPLYVVAGRDGAAWASRAVLTKGGDAQSNCRVFVGDVR